jgi:D-alanyl-D-alanine carboxypeptidase
MNLFRLIKGLLLSFVFLFLFSYITFGVQLYLENFSNRPAPGIFLADVSDSSQISVPVNKQENPDQTVPKPEIDAESAISVDSNLFDVNKIIFEKDSDVKLPIASLTKLMTAIIVLDNYNLSDNIAVSIAADSQSSVKQDIKAGDSMSVEDFLDIMLIESSNKSAYALSEKIGEPEFVNLMNQKAKALGLENTFFADPTGLSSQDVSTAGDLAKLAEYILKNYPQISKISQSKEFNVPGFGNIENTDQLLGEIPEIVCSKTGFTTAAKGCLLLVTNSPEGPEGYPDYSINVILGADDRFLEMRKLINWVDSSCN